MNSIFSRLRRKRRRFTSPRLVKINAEIPSQPPNPTTPSIMSTAPRVSTPILAGGTELLSAEEMSALISQQAVTATIQGAASKTCGTTRNGIVLPGPAGMTTIQWANSRQAKPGSAAAMTTLMNQGMPPQRLMTSLSATSSNQMLASTQSAVVKDSYVASSNQLLKRGIATISDAGSPAVSALIAVGGSLGLKAMNAFLDAPKGLGIQAAIGSVTGTLSGAYNGAISAITGPIAAGAKFATQLAGSLSSGVQGLSSSVSGLFSSGLSSVTNLFKSGGGGLSLSSAGGLISAGISSISSFFGGKVGNLLGAGKANTFSIANLAASLRNTLKSAVAAVEASYKNLSAGQPNKLGGSDTPGAKLNTPSSLYDSTVAEVESCETKLFEAKKAYRNENTPETTAALREAEANLTAARQKQAAASKAVISGAVGSITGLFGSSSPATTQNSGLNILPGGVSAVISQISSATGTVTGALGSAVGAIAGKIGGVAGTLTGALSSAFSSPSSLVGNLVSNTSKLLGNLGGSLSGALSGSFSGILTSLGSLGSGPAQVKSAVAAVNTIDTAEQTAKFGTLVGNPIIPSFAAVSAELNTNSTPDEYVGQVTAALDKLTSSQEDERKQRQKLESFDETTIDTPAYTTEWNKYEELRKATIVAQEQYAALIT